MCKILVMPGVKTAEKDKLVAFVKGMGVEMTRGNEHGLGYAAFGNNGDMFSERWLRNSDAFERRFSYGPVTTEVIKSYQGLLSTDELYNSSGVIDLQNLSSIILHTRFATSGREFCNTHPFIKSNTALIHNGMIHNHQRFDKTISSCDSESILTQYLKHNVQDDPKNIKKALNDLTGYYACGVLAHMDDVPVVDVFKNETANLSAAYIMEFGTTIFTTDVKDLVKVAADVGLTVINVFEVKSNLMVRHHAITGNVIGVYETEAPVSYNKQSYTPPYDYRDSHMGSTSRWEAAKQLPATKVEPKKEMSEWKNKFYNEKDGQWLDKPIVD